MRRILLSGLFMALGVALFATNRTDSIAIRFNLSRSNINPSLAGNLSRLDSLVNDVAADSSRFPHSVITFVGGASPEGPVFLNDTLSEHRARSVAGYVGQHVNLPDSLVRYSFLGADWRGLRTFVDADSRVPARDDVLALIDTVLSRPHPSADDIIRLKQLNGGRSYSYLFRKYFPALRESHVVIVHPSVAAMFPPAAKPSYSAPAELASFTPEVFMAEDELVDVCHPRYIGLKTNMLYDVLALPTVGIDWYVGRNWSIAASWTYGWWDKNSRHRYWRAYGGDIAVRRWFGKKALEKPLTGHHLGVYGGVVTYDFEFGGKGYMAGLPGKPLWSRCSFMAGIEYGYSLPIARRLNIDFTIGIGWLGGKVIEYEPQGDFYVWEKTRNRNWIGPTKAEISLVWLVGCGNVNKSKGGNR